MLYKILFDYKIRQKTIILFPSPPLLLLPPPPPPPPPLLPPPPSPPPLLPPPPLPPSCLSLFIHLKKVSLLIPQSAHIQ